MAQAHHLGKPQLSNECQIIMLNCTIVGNFKIGAFPESACPTVNPTPLTFKYILKRFDSFFYAGPISAVPYQ